MIDTKKHSVLGRHECQVIFKKWAEANFNHLHHREINVPLWHYTSGGALVDIVKSQTIWSTHVTCLNDYSEFSYWLDIVRECMLDLAFKKDPPDYFFFLIDSIRSAFNVSTAAHARVYVACLSEQKDDLSQWRSYGLGEGGYAIQFNGEMLYDSAKTLGLYLAKVNYDPSYHRSQATEVAKKLMLFCDNLTNTSLPGEQQSKIYLEFLTECLKYLCHVAPVFKDTSFYAEQEWRLISAHPDKDLEKCMTFTHRGQSLRSHIPLPLRSKSDAHRLPIEGVILGPMRNPEGSRRSVVELLRRAGFPASVHDSVAVSRVPYQLP